MNELDDDFKVNTSQATQTIDVDIDLSEIDAELEEILSEVIEEKPQISEEKVPEESQANEITQINS